MKPSVTHFAGWLIIGLTVLPLVPASAEQREASPSTERVVAGRLQWLLAAHDLRYALTLPAIAGEADSCAGHCDCGGSEVESDR